LRIPVGSHARLSLASGWLVKNLDYTQNPTLQLKACNGLRLQQLITTVEGPVRDRANPVLEFTTAAALDSPSINPDK
jgi:hypothetical protein